MLHDQRQRDEEEDDSGADVRDIYALTLSPHPSSTRGSRRESWEASSLRSSTLSVGSEVENLPSMSREFNAMVVAGSNIQRDGSSNTINNNNSIGDTSNLARILEEELEETNPLAIVPGANPVPSPLRRSSSADNLVETLSVHRVKRDEVETKISAWQAEEIAKINNRFKREDVVINGWETEKVENAGSWLKKVERKIEEKRARAVEKTQNGVAKARRKAEEKRATAEAKRGVKVARVTELANFLKAVGRAPSKRSFF